MTTEENMEAAKERYAQQYAEWRGTDPNDYAFIGAGGRLVVMVEGKYQFMAPYKHPE